MNICLLVAATFFVVASASVPDVEARKYPVLNWWMNQLDWFLTTMTVWYCFNIGLYNVYNFNDGGIAFYECLTSFVEPITYA